VVNGTKTNISPALKFVKSYNALPSAKGSKFDQKSIMLVLLEAINANKLPMDPNGIYAIIFRGDFQFPGFLVEWCGYHSTLVMNTPTGATIKINFFVVGDPETASNGLGFACAEYMNNTANGSVGGDSIANVYAHEVLESVTNYDQKGWFFDLSSSCAPIVCAGYENADFCNWSFGIDEKVNSNMVIAGKPYLIQTVWQPSYGCVLKKQ